MQLHIWDKSFKQLTPSGPATRAHAGLWRYRSTSEAILPSMIGGSDIPTRVQVLGTLNGADFNQLFADYTITTSRQSIQISSCDTASRFILVSPEQGLWSLGHL